MDLFHYRVDLQHQLVSTRGWQHAAAAAGKQRIVKQQPQARQRIADRRLGTVQTSAGSGDVTRLV
ncbi:hypothetical protein D3C71_1813570 [compost metagenome]